MRISRKEVPDLVWQVTSLVEGKRDARDEVEKNFVEYHKANPHVFVDFSYFAKVAIDAGKEKGSAWHIVNRLRWEYYIKAVDLNTEFTICNDYIALYARLWMENNREYVDWFNTKLRKVEIAHCKLNGYDVPNISEGRK